MSNHEERTSTATAGRAASGDHDATAQDESNEGDDGLTYDLDDSIGGGDPSAILDVFSHLGEAGPSAARSPSAIVQMATAGAARPVEPGLLAEGARPPQTRKHGGSQTIQSVMDLAWMITGGGQANGPGDAEEARNAPKSLTDTEHLVTLLTLGGAALTGAAVAGGLTKVGASSLLANLAGGAAAGGVARGGADVVDGEVSSPATYLRDMLLGAVAGGAFAGESKPASPRVDGVQRGARIADGADGGAQAAATARGAEAATEGAEAAAGSAGQKGPPPLVQTPPADQGGEFTKSAGRRGKQKRLRELSRDPKVASSDRGWLQQDANQIKRGKRAKLRNPPGKDLAHERGREAAKGFGYEHSHLQDEVLHDLQHKYDNFGRKNKKRPVE